MAESVRDLVLDLWKTPTERDKQVRVGASNMSQPCARCMADGLLPVLTGVNPSQEASPYWLGAAIGTAIHERLETLISHHRPTWLSERKVVIGELEKYGVIKSTLDLYIPPRVVDFKTTTREKLKALKEALTTEPTEYDLSKVREARYKATSYVYQTMLYAWGLEQEGYPVESVAILFICRDGVGDRDIWDYEMPYDRAVAEKAWDRLVRLWEWLQAGNNPATLLSHPECYTCRNMREED